MLRRILIAAIACACMLLGFLSGIYYTVTNAEISIMPEREICIDILGNRWVHTIEE